MDETLLRAVKLFGTSMAIGLLIGLERERKADSRGIRTFGLISLLGTMVATLASLLAMPQLVAVGVAMLGLIAIAAYWGEGRDRLTGSEAPTTSVIAMTLTGCLGILCGLEQERLAVALGIVIVSLLYFKGELRGIAGRIGRADLIPVLQFGALTFIVLPLLPDHAYGPHGSLNPHEIWLTIVLVSGVGLIGYLTLRFAGQRFGMPLAAIAGGLVSSTATTLVFARSSDTSPGSAAIRSMMVMLANLTMLIRLAIMAAIIRPDLLRPIAPVMGSTAAAGLLWAAWLQRRLAKTGAIPLPVVQNPTQLRVALLFGLSYAVVSLLAAWSAAQVGGSALYVVAAISGLTDVDAIALSAFRLEAAGSIDAGAAVMAIAIGVIANLVLKTVMVFTVGTRELAWLCATGFGAMAMALAVTAILH
jgi:uncharacterized membrane protein (DUF4010 family)